MFKPMILLCFLTVCGLYLGGCQPKSSPTAVLSDSTTIYRTSASTVTTAETDSAVTTVTETSASVPTTADPLVPETVEPNTNIPDDEPVRVSDYIPDIVVELKYATTDNFTGDIIYDFKDAFLRYGTVKKLQTVQNALRKQGLSLKIWDAFRPVSAQFRLWEVYPDAAFVANPTNGYSSHSRGNTVDLTIVDASGNELAMPSAFDDFSSAADRRYNDCDENAKSHALLLENLMTEHGFKGYFNEWWHYTDTVDYPVEKHFSPPH